MKISEAIKRLPTTLEGLFESSFSNLEEQQQKVLLHMSVLRTLVPRQFLSYLAEISPQRLDRILRRLLESGLIIARDSARGRYYSICHAVLQDFLLNKLKDSKEYSMSDIHKRAAAAFYGRIEKDRNDSEALAEYTCHLKESGDRRAFIQGLDRVRHDKHRIGLYGQLREELSEALSYQEINDNLESRAWFLNALGLVQGSLGELGDALKSDQEAAKFFRKIKHRGGQAAQYGNIGLVLSDQGDLDGALENHRKALEINRRLGRREGMAANYGNIGLVLSDQGDLEGALENHRKALQIDEKMGKLSGMAEDYGNIGNVLYDQDDLEGALENHRKALEINEKIGRPEGMANNYGNIGNVLYKRDDLEGALENYKKSLEITQRIGLHSISANQYINIANIHTLKKDYKSSALLQVKAFSIYSRIGMKRNVEDARARLSTSVGKLKKQGKYEGFLREAKEEFGGEVEGLLAELSTAD